MSKEYAFVWSVWGMVVQNSEKLKPSYFWGRVKSKAGKVADLS